MHSSKRPLAGWLSGEVDAELTVAFDAISAGPSALSSVRAGIPDVSFVRRVTTASQSLQRASGKVVEHRGHTVPSS